MLLLQFLILSLFMPTPTSFTLMKKKTCAVTELWSWFGLVVSLFGALFYLSFWTVFIVQMVFYSVNSSFSFSICWCNSSTRFIRIFTCCLAFQFLRFDFVFLLCSFFSLFLSLFSHLNSHIFNSFCILCSFFLFYFWFILWSTWILVAVVKYIRLYCTIHLLFFPSVHFFSFHVKIKS